MESSTLQTLPDDLIGEVSGYSTNEDTASLGVTNKSFNKILADKKLIKYHLKKEDDVLE